MRGKNVLICVTNGQSLSGVIRLQNLRISDKTMFFPIYVLLSVGNNLPKTRVS